MGSNYADRFHPASDYKAAFVEEVDRLLDLEMPIEERLRAVEALTDAYMDQVHESPDSVQLSRLASFILRDEMRDGHPDKMRREPYPVLTLRQSKRRQDRERMVGERTADLSCKHQHNRWAVGF